MHVARPHPRGTPAQRLAKALAGVALGALLLSGCMSSGYTYVTNQDLGAYFRVPSNYAVYGADEVLGQATNGMPEETAAQIREQQWAVAFDSDDEPTVDRFLSQLGGPADEPAGYARVRTLGVEERLSYSLQSLRSELLPFDELQQLGQEVSIVELDELHQDAGHGLRVVFSLELDGGTLVFEQLALIDDTASRVYLLALGCSADCFDTHRDEIASITGSWTIEER